MRDLQRDLFLELCGHEWRTPPALVSARISRFSQAGLRERVLRGVIGFAPEQLAHSNRDRIFGVHCHPNLFGQNRTLGLRLSALCQREVFRILHPVELYLALDRKVRRGCERKERTRSACNGDSRRR
jgi:hypothetical protein